MRLSNVDRIIVVQINVNSIRNKFDALKTEIQNKVDILLISETKLKVYRDKLKKQKMDYWIPCNPHNAEVSSHMNCMGKAIDSLSSRHENFLLIGDFSAEVLDMSMKVSQKLSQKSN